MEKAKIGDRKEGCLGLPIFFQSFPCGSALQDDERLGKIRAIRRAAGKQFLLF
jgi:hypothetical protein